MPAKRKWALVLGASSGFGEAASLALARAGRNVFGVHLDRRSTLPNVERITGEIEAAGARADVLQHERRRRREAGRGDRRDVAGPRRTRRTPGRDRRRPPLARVRDAQAVPRRDAGRPDRAGPDGDDARRHGALARLLGAGPPRGGPPGRGRARLRDDVGRRPPDLDVLRRGLGRQGRPREPLPAARGGARRRGRSPSTRSAPASPTRPPSGRSPATSR